MASLKWNFQVQTKHIYKSIMQVEVLIFLLSFLGANTVDHGMSQKERDHLKEAKQKLGDMRATIHTLRGQKRELDRRIMEMQSTVSSLREEQKTIESALEEKQNEINTLKDRSTSIYKETPEVSFRSIESEFEDLKHHPELPLNLWSVSTDDPSNTSLNSQMKTRTTERDDKFNRQKESSGESNTSANQEVLENSKEHADSTGEDSGNKRSEEVAKQGEVRRENGGETAQSRQTTEEQPQKQDNSKESNTKERIVQGKEKNSDKSQNGGKGRETAKTERVRNHDSKAQRPGDETNGGHILGDKVTETAADGMLGSNAHDAEIQDLGENFKGGVKLEMSDNIRIGRHGRKGKSSNLKRTRGKRWTIMTSSKAGNSDNNGTAVMSDKVSLRSTSAETLDLSESQNKGSSMRNETRTEDSELKMTDNLQKAEASVQEASKDEGQEATDTANYIQMEEHERTNGTSIKAEMVRVFAKDEPKNMTVHTEDSRASMEGEQSILEIGQKQAMRVQELPEEIALQKEDDFSDQMKLSDFDEEPNNPETEDLQKQESETGTLSEFTLNSEADGEEREGENEKLEI